MKRQLVVSKRSSGGSVSKQTANWVLCARWANGDDWRKRRLVPIANESRSGRGDDKHVCLLFIRLFSEKCISFTTSSSSSPLLLLRIRCCSLNSIQYLCQWLSKSYQKKIVSQEHVIHRQRKYIDTEHYHSRNTLNNETIGEGFELR